ncbi:type III secretion system outer membrane ring subunit SctC [Stenotrophomonas sp. 169]|uniref:type III secretion system outer membrane ring subunit SctC n=1 Tax=Stenotrophomonas sp. 169 TaxID=2770322 RepID=UPI00166227C4|nr:type III secretion system outer membrane ring subunit SctC [Stenotrophomonas sp. 169]QNR97303.1 type III secretion system outer membrane ring subunit SctC [Stenotrophomonas sp. 169]
MNFSCRTLSLFALLATSTLLTPLSAHAQTNADIPLENTPIRHRGELSADTTFVSRGDGVSLLLQSVAAQMKVPVIVSSRAQKKRIQGSFNLTEPRALLDQIARDVGLIWYSDGQTLYVHDASETRNAVGHMQHASLAVLDDFLRRTRLADTRHALRGAAGDGTFYVSGSPVYVEIVLNAARYLDELYRGADARAEHVEVITLRNSFAQGRRYGMRSWDTTLPGMAEVLASVLTDSGVSNIIVRRPEPDALVEDPSSDAAVATRQGVAVDGDARRSATRASAGGASPPTIVVAYPETNSLIVRGTLSGIQKVKQLVAELDLPRKQVELSLWIIDVQKKQLDALGVKWSGQVGLGGRLGLGFNGATSTLDGERFLASVTALSERGHASVVSRPVLLTQENVLAHFDSNSTFYARLQSERAASLEAVTYGTLISVLPRVSAEDEVEMQLKIEDGTSSGKEVEGLPVINRTTIDTVARVPHHLSLLVGGYTRHEQARDRTAIPGLGRIPFLGNAFRHRSDRHQELVRVFLIQPRVRTPDDLLPGAGFNTLDDLALPLPAHLERVRGSVREALHGTD